MPNLGDVAPRGADWVGRELKQLRDEVRSLRSARVGNTIQPEAIYAPDFNVATGVGVGTIISSHIDVPSGFRTAAVVITVEWIGYRPAADPGTYQMMLQAFIGEFDAFSPSSYTETFPVSDSSARLSQTLATTLTGPALGDTLVVGAIGSASGPWDHGSASVSGIALFLR